MLHTPAECCAVSDSIPNHANCRAQMFADLVALSALFGCLSILGSRSTLSSLMESSLLPEHPLTDFFTLQIKKTQAKHSNRAHGLREGESFFFAEGFWEQLSPDDTPNVAKFSVICKGHFSQGPFFFFFPCTCNLPASRISHDGSIPIQKPMFWRQDVEDEIH